MAHFGNFAAAVSALDHAETGDQPAEVDTFGWFEDTQICLRPHIPPIAFTRFFAARSNTDAEAELYRLLKAAIEPVDWDLFEDLAEKHNVDALGLLEVVNQIVGARQDRPTSQSAASSPGSSTTTPSSTPASVPPAADPLSKSEQLARDLGITTLPENRPELRLALVRVDEEIPAEEIQQAVG